MVIDDYEYHIQRATWERLRRALRHKQIKIVATGKGEVVAQVVRMFNMPVTPSPGITRAVSATWANSPISLAVAGRISNPIAFLPGICT